MTLSTECQHHDDFSEQISYFLLKQSAVVCCLFPIWQYVQTAVPLVLLNLRTCFPVLPDASSSSPPAQPRNPSCSKQAPRTRPLMLPPVSYFPVRSQRTRPSSLPRPTLHNSVLPTRTLHCHCHICFWEYSHTCRIIFHLCF